MSITTPSKPLPVLTPSTAEGRRPHRTSAHRFGRLQRRVPEALASIGLFLLVFAQHPGRIVRDTKLDLSVDPGRFIASVTHLWDPLIGFGTVPDQAYGYLFPMGPFYWLGSALHVPEWMVQRLWMGLLLTVALWGTVRLAECLQIGGRWSRLAGGIAYALSPIILAQAHDTSYVLPAVLLPWVIAPLVRAADGTLTPGGGAARSGLAILLMGGVNATATFAVLLLPLMWFATRRPIRQHIKLFALWAAAIVLASAWFIVPLVFQKKYGFNFLPFTETSNTTTSITSIPEVLRGGGVWVSLSNPPIWTPAGFMIETSPVVIVASSVVAGLGLYGLARRDLRDRLFLVLAVIVGTVLVCAGYWGHFGGPFASTTHTLLDGPLAAFRNVYKFQPVIALALVLGLVHALEQFSGALRKLRWSEKNSLLSGFVIVTAVVLALTAAPMFTGKLYPEGSFTAIPAYWHQATNWINARGAMSNTLVIPGDEFARLNWGNPLDQPIQPLATVPWANRNVVPLGSIGNTQFLDALDQVLASGQPVPGLAQYLSRAGVRYLLVENDLNPAEAVSPAPAVVRTVLANEPGISRTARFGPVVRQPNSGSSVEFLYDPFGLTHGIRSLEVYRVASTSGGDAMVTTYPASTGISLSGGPQGLLPLAGSGQLDHQAVALNGDPLGPRFQSTAPVVADTQQLRNTAFPSLYGEFSNLLAPGEPSIQTGVQPHQWIVVPGTQHETVSKLGGALGVSASSFGPWFRNAPADQPLSAFLDNAGGSTWEAAPFDPRPWIEIRFDHPVPLQQIIVTPSSTGPSYITRVQVSTGRGQLTSPLAPTTRPQAVPTPRGDTRFLKITLVNFRGPRGPLSVGPGIAHIAIPGVTVTQTWRVPNDVRSGTGITPTYLFISPLPNQFGFFKVADDEPHMSRTFTVPQTSTLSVSGEATPRSSLALEALEFPKAGQPVTPLASLSKPYALACGSGPTLTIDGSPYQTSLSGTMGEYLGLRAMPMTVCKPGGTVTLPAGTHTITADDASGGFKVTSISLTGTTVPQSTAPRGVTVDRWGSESRSLTVAGGQGAILNVHQNYNSGWVATVNGHQLHPVRLDGWQQGWLLPAATAAQVVTLRFTPEGPFRTTLVVGAGLALVLVVWALLSARRRWRDRSSADRGVDDDPEVGVDVPAEGAADGDPGDGSFRDGRLWLAWVVLTAAIFAISGPVAMAVPLLIIVRWLVPRRFSLLAWSALGALVFAGIAIAIGTGYRIGTWIGGGSYTAQALGGLAIAALVLSLLPNPHRRREA